MEASDIEDYCRLAISVRPNADNVEQGISKFWRHLSPELARPGTSAGPPDEQRFRLLLTPQRPTGWFIAIDVSDDFRTAEEVYWFPYIGPSIRLDRAGLALERESALRARLLTALQESIASGTKPTQQDIAMWARLIGPSIASLE